LFSADLSDRLRQSSFTNYRLRHLDEIEAHIMIDEKKLQQFLGKMIVDLGAAISVPLVRSLQGNERGRADEQRGVRQEGKHLRTLRPRMARAKRGLRLSDLRTRQPTIRVAVRTSDGIRERRKSILLGRWI
jgi:hypothetical protein